MVGTIKYAALDGAGNPDTDEIPPGSSVTKGQDLGYFKFGGSTVLCLWEPGNTRVMLQSIQIYHSPSLDSWNVQGAL
jgi:hypothetical protein